MLALGGVAYGSLVDAALHEVEEGGRRGGCWCLVEAVNHGDGEELAAFIHEADELVNLCHAVVDASVEQFGIFPADNAASFKLTFEHLDKGRDETTFILICANFQVNSRGFCFGGLFFSVKYGPDNHFVH